MGSENRYLTRLFALRFTDASRISTYLNFNNLNDKRKPGESSKWTPDKMPQGLLSQKMGGVDYQIKPKRTNNKFAGNAELSYVDADNYSETTTENYLDGGNTYSKSRSKSRNDNFSFNISNKWEFRQQDGVSGLKLTPTLSYSHFNNRLVCHIQRQSIRLCQKACFARQHTARRRRDTSQYDAEPL